MKEKRAKEILVFLMLGALLAVALLSAQGEGARRLSYREFWALAEAGQVDSVRMSGGDFWQVTLESGETRRVTVGIMTDDTTQILEGIEVGETVIY